MCAGNELYKTLKRKTKEHNTAIKKNIIYVSMNFVEHTGI